jgi:aminoglycoside phosphotransferase (APT) family kinase protein
VSRFQWESFPSGHVAAIEEVTGPVVKAESVAGGLMPGLAAVVHAASGQYFVKAAPADSPAARLYEREVAANAALSSSVPAPRMRYSSAEGGWLVMLFDFLDARDADLSPGSPDLGGVLAAVAAINAAPAWSAAPPVTVNVAALQDKAGALLAKQDGGWRGDMYRAAIADFDTAALVGDRLVHYDLHPGNLKVTADADVVAVDWAFACAGAPWLDAALLVPRLIEAGHSPAAAERLVASLPGWQTAPPPAVTALAALWTMFREYKASYGPDDARGFREQAARAGRSWVEYRIGLPGLQAVDRYLSRTGTGAGGAEPRLRSG